MIIYDIITAEYVEDGDQIIVDGDPLEDVIRFDDEDGEVLISGYSHNTGDRETYVLAFDKTVELWSV